MNVETVVSWIVGGCGALILAIFGSMWYSLSNRVEKLEIKVNDDISRELKQLNISVTEMRGELKLTNANLENLATAIDRQLKNLPDIIRSVWIPGLEYEK